jgi:hypothetical protein
VREQQTQSGKHVTHNQAPIISTVRHGTVRHRHPHHPRTIWLLLLSYCPIVLTDIWHHSKQDLDSREDFGPCQTQDPVQPLPLPATPLNLSTSTMVWHVDYYGSHVCEPCDRSFNDYSALMQHLNRSSSHNYCEGCDRDFSTNGGLVQHYANSPRHDYCQSCEEHFDDSDDLDRHMDDCHWWCRDCNKIFENEAALQAHQSQSHADRYCKICERLFTSPSGLRSVCICLVAMLQ